MQDRKQARDALCKRIETVLKADDRFVAAWLIGSLGRHSGDELSDIDLFVAVNEQIFATFCSQPWITAGRTTEERFALFAQFGEPVIIHENHRNAPDGGTFT